MRDVLARGSSQQPAVLQLVLVREGIVEYGLPWIAFSPRLVMAP